MAKRPRPKKAADRSSIPLLERVRRLLELEIADYERRIGKGQDRDKRTLVLFATEARKLDAYERKGGGEYTADSVVTWAQDLTEAERVELARRISAIDGPRGSGLA